VVLDGPLYLTRALIEPMVKDRYGRILFFVGDGSISARGSGRTHLSAAKMGLIGMAAGSPRNSLPITSGLTSFRRAASIRGATIRSGIRVACRTPPASRSGGKAASTRLPRPACS
jgi:hypothetical protein